MVLVIDMFITPSTPDDTDSEQQEPDRFIAEIEDAADREWAEEEASRLPVLGTGTKKIIM